MKITLDSIDRRLDIAGKKMNKLEDIPMETIRSETKSQKK